MEEQRTAVRGRTYLTGRVVFNDKNSTADCLVRNWTSGGAKLVFADATTMPTDFDILIPARDDSRRARTVWRRGPEAGVIFLP